MRNPGIDQATLERVALGYDEALAQDISLAITTTFTLTVRRAYFKPEGMIIDAASSTGVHSLQVTDVKVGTRSLLANDKPIGGAIFSERSVIGHLEWGELNRNDTIKVTVKCVHDSTQNVGVTVVGWASQS